MSGSTYLCSHMKHDESVWKTFESEFTHLTKHKRLTFIFLDHLSLTNITWIWLFLLHVSARPWKMCQHDMATHTYSQLIPPFYLLKAHGETCANASE